MTNSLLNNLVAYWKFDETTGTSRADSSVNGHTATLSNSSMYTASGFLNAGIQGVTSQHCDTGVATSALGANGSINLWAYPTTLYNSGVLYRVLGAYDGSNEFTFMHYSSNTIYMGFNGTGGDFRATVAASSSNWIQNTWQMFTLTWASGGNTLLYHNVTQIASHASTTVPTIATTLYLTDENGITGFPFAGNIDEVGFWNKILSSTDVTNLYAAGAGLPFSSFDNGSGGFTPVFRKSLSPIGGRIGSRQIWAA